MTTELSTTANQDAETSTWRRPSPWLLVLLVLGAFLRLYGLSSEALTYDDMYAANFASDGFFHMLADIARFDIHPPVYFFQLWVWMHAYDGADFWLSLNSVLWGMLSLVSIYFITERVFGRRVAIAATLFLAVTPIHITFSREARQYAFLTTLVPWAWYFSRSYLLEGRRFWWMMVSALLVIYTLGTGIVQAMYIGIFGLGLILDHRPPRRRMINWFVAQAAVVVLSLPAVFNGVVRSGSGHLIEPDLAAILQTGSYVSGANTFQDSAVPALLLYATLALFLVTAVFMKRGRWLVVVFGPLPFLFAIVISYAIRPIWHFRQFIFLAPFFCMSLSLTLDFWLGRLEKSQGVGFRKWAFGTVVALVFALGLVGSWAEASRERRPPTYRIALEHISQELEPGDVILVPHNSDYWGVAWYFIGPRWGSPVKIQDSIPEQAAPNKWGKILARLGPVWRQRLLLEPESNFVEKDGVRLYIGYGSGPEVASLKPKRVYVLTFPEIGAHTRPLPEIPGYTHDESEDRWFKPSQYYVGLKMLLWRAPVEAAPAKLPAAELPEGASGVEPPPAAGDAEESAPSD